MSQVTHSDGARGIRRPLPGAAEQTAGTPDHAGRGRWRQGRASGLVALLVVGVVTLVGCGTPADAPPRGRPVLVERVLDGDTVVTSEGERVRLLGLDAPELGSDTTPAECGAVEATQALTGLVGGRTVQLVGDPVAAQSDQYGRTLAYLEVDGQDVGLQLIGDGWAEAWVPEEEPHPARWFVYSIADGAAEFARINGWIGCPRDGSGAEVTR